MSSTPLFRLATRIPSVVEGTGIHYKQMYDSSVIFGEFKDEAPDIKTLGISIPCYSRNFILIV